jgi:hypothetical protein
MIGPNRLLRNLRRSSSRTRYRSRLCLDYLEERTLPASVFVVPLTVPEDATHFHSIADAAAAAGTNGLVTVESGTDSSGPLAHILGDGVTIQGDPSVQPSDLTSYDLGIDASNITLTHMHLGRVGFGISAQFATISHCLIQDGDLVAGGGISALPLRLLISQSVFDQGGLQIRAALGGNNPQVTAVDNVFNPGVVTIDLAACAILRGNQFVGGFGTPVVLGSALTSTAPTVIQDNEILLSTPGITAIEINTASDNFVNVLNNRIYTDYGGTAIEINDMSNAHVFIQGNDLQGNRVGVSVNASNPFGTNVDLGSSFGSLGGNDFRGFTSPATSTAAAISFATTSTLALSAENNIFSAGVDPNSVINDATHGSYTGAGTIDVGSPLSQAQAFVQTLYNHVLRRTGSLPELVAWTNLLASAGQSAVETGILHSPESLGRIVDDLYMRLLGRQSDPIGRNNGVGFLASGGSIEQLEDLILTSPEYTGQNANWVQSLYLNVLDRPGSDAEVAAWNNAEPTLGLAAIAAAFTSSAEARAVATVADYRTFLHRTPTAGEVMVVTGLPLDLLGIENFLLLSPEYYSNG